MRKDTRIHLVQELEAINPRTPAIEFMIQEAKAGEYHDYKNNKYDCGKVAASTALRSVGLVDLAKRVESGEFAEVADENDKAMMRQGLDENLWDTFGLRPDPSTTIPRFRGQVGQCLDRNEVHYGKWFFEISVWDFSGKIEAGPPIQIGPWESEKIAGKEMKKVIKIACESAEKHLTGKVSGKFFDLNSGGDLRSWDDN